MRDIQLLGTLTPLSPAEELQASEERAKFKGQTTRSARWEKLPRVGGEGMLEKFRWYKQSSYKWQGAGKTIYIDPWDIPQGDAEADAIFITHAHFDHFSRKDIEKVQRSSTVIVAPRDVARELSGRVIPIAPGDKGEAAGITYEAVPAYNVVEGRLDYHPKANNWVGYLLELDGYTYYHAGDTDHLPELEKLSCHVAFVPIGGTYCMDVSEASGLVKVIKPQIAVPMHYGFVEGVGKAEDGRRFKEEASPVEVELLEPYHPFTS
ncbi:MAG: Zn-dependent hydrolase [Acidimicrobiia bacterium]